MPRTYGEVLEVSYPQIFQFCDKTTVFVDVGSGYGKLVKGAVENFNCVFGIGIEKYKDNDGSLELLKGCDKELQLKLKFVFQDINDTDFGELLEGLEFDTLLIFCNNLAFTEGTVQRFAKKCQSTKDSLASKKVVIISTVQLHPLDQWTTSLVDLGMTWNDKQHESYVYQMLGEAPAIAG